MPGGENKAQNRTHISTRAATPSPPGGTRQAGNRDTPAPHAATQGHKTHDNRGKPPPLAEKSSLARRVKYIQKFCLYIQNFCLYKQKFCFNIQKFCFYLTRRDRQADARTGDRVALPQPPPNPDGKGATNSAGYKKAWGRRANPLRPRRLVVCAALRRSADYAVLRVLDEMEYLDNLIALRHLVLDFLQRVGHAEV